MILFSSTLNEKNIYVGACIHVYIFHIGTKNDDDDRKLHSYSKFPIEPMPLFIQILLYLYI